MKNVPIFSAPAKLNLMLHVVGRRADGYHQLQTVFQLIDLCDRIEIAVREDGVLARPKGPAGVAEEADLVIRAARALKRRPALRWARIFRFTSAFRWAGGWAAAARTPPPRSWP